MIFLVKNAEECDKLWARFWSKVDKAAGPDGCWPFKGAHAPKFEYGAFHVGGKKGRAMGAHRVSWALEHGSVPDDLCVLHKCDNPPCVNPKHLFLGTRTDNMADKVAKGRATGAINPVRGEASWKAKLTTAQVLDIRRRAAAGELHYRIAADYGVVKSAVSMIVRRENWKHVPAEAV